MRVLLLPSLALLAISVAAQAQERDALRPSVDPRFKPQLVSVDFTSRHVRPGAAVGVTYRFRNAGSKPARGDWRVFVHLEHPKKSCTDLVVNLDHLPLLPTSAWEPGQVISDGPHVFTAPTDKEGDYYVHVGVYCPEVKGGPRLLDQYAGTFKVSKNAPAAKDFGPKPLAAAEVQRRRQRLAQRITEPLDIVGPDFVFRIDRRTLAFDLLDKATGVRWTSSPLTSPLVRVQLADGQATRSVLVRDADQWLTGRAAGGPPGLVLVKQLTIGEAPAGVTFRLRFSLTPERDGIRVRYDAEEAGGWKVRSVRLFENAFGVTDADDGYLVLSQGIGKLLHVRDALPQTLGLYTYSHLHMAMCGLVKQGSGLVVAWPEPETVLRVQVDWPKSDLVPGARLAGVGVELSGRSHEATIHPIGRAGYVDIAKAYRPIAKRNGWLMPWSEKRKQFPTTDAMFGCADFKPFTFVRVIPSSRYGGKTERLHVGYTFDEVAQCAEHWRHDLGIDKAMVVMAGWIHRGYDNQHPDVLPAAPECGGNAALARAAKRIRAQGYLFGLHDNYQDMYRDAPSWDEKYLNRDRHGRVRKGGNWAGGQAYQVCAIKQVELAARSDTNLPMVAKLFGPTIYFIDTTFAWGLVTCEDPAHPMTRYDDMVWKSKLCDLSKEHFGLFGSEKGREWAVPHADYMEGMLSDKTRATKTSDVIPLFPLVYGDCTNLYTHQGDRIGPGSGKKILDHVLYAEMPVYAFGRHIYWKGKGAKALPVQPLAPRVKALGEFDFEITYRWKVLGQVKKDLRCFVHFAHPKAKRSENIAYQDDHSPDPPITQWQPGTVVEIGPRKVSIPPQYAGESRLMIGITGEGGRQTLSNVYGGGGRYDLGTIRTTPKGPVFAPTRDTNAACFSRADGGWAQGMCATDRMIKNTYEVLSYLNRIAAETPMTDHAFVTPDHRVERTAFGDVAVVVNYGPEPYSHNGTVLPAYGFVVTSPTFVAFHASHHNGIDYSPTALFTIRSLDGNPIEQSAKVRIYHGFGPTRVRLGRKMFEVERALVVSMR